MQTNYNDFYRQPLIEENLSDLDVERRVEENLDDPEVESFTVWKMKDETQGMNRHQRRRHAAMMRKSR